MLCPFTDGKQRLSMLLAMKVLSSSTLTPFVMLILLYLLSNRLSFLNPELEYVPPKGCHQIDIAPKMCFHETNKDIAVCILKNESNSREESLERLSILGLFVCLFFFVHKEVKL